MKKILKNNKIVITILFIALMMGVVYNTGAFKSKADDYDSTEKSYIEELREMNKEEITIESIDELYNALNNLNDMSEESVNNVLASSADDVIVEFINNEECLINESICGVLNAENENDLENEKNINTEIKHYVNDTDTKTEIIIRTKYGTECQIQMIDEKDRESVTRGNWVLVGDWNENMTKPYGDRRFTFSNQCRSSWLADHEAWSRLGYNVSDKGVTARYVEASAGEETVLVSGTEKSTLNLKSKRIIDSSATKCGEQIKAEVMYNHKLTGAFGISASSTIKVNLSAEIVAWSKDNEQMSITHFVKVYEDK